MNRKGNVGGIIVVAGILFVVLLISLILAFGSMIVQWSADIVIPEVSNLGQVGSTNLTDTASYTFAPVNTVVQSLTWASGFMYILFLICCIGLSFAYRFTGAKWLAGLWIMLMVILIITSIFISNIYEGFYTGTDAVATYLQSYILLSWLILYSPAVFSVLGFFCGIIMFTGSEEEIL